MSVDRAMARLMGILEGEPVAVYGSCRPEHNVVRDGAGVARHYITTSILELNISGDPSAVEDLINRLASGLVDDGGEEA